MSMQTEKGGLGVLLDPRVEANAEEIKKLKKAILILAGNLDGVSWRVSTEEERKAGVEIYDRIQKTLTRKEA